MKKLDKRWTVRLGALGLSAVLLGTGAALATGGDQSDPLITLSYFNETGIPQVVEQVEEKMIPKQKELEQALKALIDQYAQGGGQTDVPSSGSASYTLVSMTNGQVMSLGVGCEVQPRPHRSVHRRDHRQRRRPHQESPVHGHHRRPDPHRLRQRREAAGAGELVRRVSQDERRPPGETRAGALIVPVCSPCRP